MRVPPLHEVSTDSAVGMTLLPLSDGETPDSAPGLPSKESEKHLLLSLQPGGGWVLDWVSLALTGTGSLPPLL